MSNSLESEKELSGSSSTQGPAALGWSPVREKLAPFKTLVAQAEDAAVHWYSEKGLESLQRMVEIWDRIFKDSHFKSTPLTFKLDILNRTGVAHCNMGIELKSDAELETAEGLFTYALHLIPEDWSVAWRYLSNLGGVALQHYHHSGALAYLEKINPIQSRGRLSRSYRNSESGSSSL